VVDFRKNRKNNQPVTIQCIWLHLETSMMTTTLEDDSRAPLVLLTLEKKGKTINL
jgi:hypothetical protein